MPTPCQIVRLHAAERDDIADLVTRRPVPGRGLDRLGAFLFLNHHGPQTYPPNNRGLPFGPHPHRGFETVTFILDGELSHSDSGGHESIIGAGGVQWMTAGRGIVHAELSPNSFMRSGGRLEILQLWVNLPARLKLTTPRYVGLQRDDIPVITAAGGAQLRLIAGTQDDVSGPVPSLTGVFMSVLDLPAGAIQRFTGLSGRDVFLYVVDGAIQIGDRAAPRWTLVELSAGDTVDIAATAQSTVLFGHAAPIDEPVVAHGPFVMTTADEIRQAYADYRAGNFV